MKNQKLISEKGVDLPKAQGPPPGLPKGARGKKGKLINTSLKSIEDKEEQL